MRPGSALALAMCLLAGRAAAEEKHACVRASDRGQELRDDAKLRAARQEFVTCARAVCPSIVRAFCAQRIEEVDRALPTVVVRARDAAGVDAVDVRVSIDGAVVTTKLDGSPITMDPGEHTFRYERAGAPAIEQRVLLRTGEKNRALDVSFAPPPRAERPPPPVAAPVPVAAPPPVTLVTRRPVRASTLVVAGAGVLALGASGILVLSARGDVADLRARCAPACDDAEADPARTKVLFANIAAGVGGAALVTALVLYLTRPTETRAASAVTLGGGPIAGGGAAAIRVRF